ncbi:extracellular matrix protein 1 [Xenopus laevis]|uniref:Extracellular matrix protein 1 n=2 Tax=Xenopus laevis TaxID=8355 RepID=A0A1L8FBW7_XENLA|nr:extracellular matrix protein 1 [Xenopus laevis]OCT69067.1 hypothetical protein XELAEV_18040375mg [Xenopus laevis]
MNYWVVWILSVQLSLVLGQLIIVYSGKPPEIYIPKICIKAFPPGFPVSSNIGNICSTERVKANCGRHNLPTNSFGHLLRQAEAINSLEEGYKKCCEQSDKLSCAETAWKKTLEDYCEEEISIKTKGNVCCNRQGAARELCFSITAPDPNYGADSSQEGESPVRHARGLNRCPPLLPNCLGKAKNEAPNLPFPPGKPESGNIRNMCSLRHVRPRYGIMQLPVGKSYVQQTQALDLLEDEYEKCCEDENVPCANAAWEKVLAEFCTWKREADNKPYKCCQKQSRISMYSCFARRAPYPQYDREIVNKE